MATFVIWIQKCLKLYDFVCLLLVVTVATSHNNNSSRIYFHGFEMVYENCKKTVLCKMPCIRHNMYIELKHGTATMTCIHICAYVCVYVCICTCTYVTRPAKINHVSAKKLLIFSVFTLS